MRALCLGLSVLALRCRVLGLRFGVFGRGSLMDQRGMRYGFGFVVLGFPI